MAKNTKINSYIYNIELSGWGQVVVNAESEEQAQEIVENYNPIENMRNVDHWDIGVKKIEKIDELIKHDDTIGIEGDTYLTQCKKCNTIFDHKMRENCPLCELKAFVESLPTNIDKQSSDAFCLSCGETFDTRLTKRCPLCSDSSRNNHS